MESLEFSEDEIREQLAVLGYKNVPRHRLREVKQDLDALIQSLTSPVRGQTLCAGAPPAVTKEKVSHVSKEGFVLHQRGDDETLPRVAPADLRVSGPSAALLEPVRLCDSYSQHSITARQRLPYGTSSGLQVEPDQDHTALTHDSSSPDTRDQRVFRRKVLRKRQGQFLVCDESVYSDDSGAASSLDERLSQLHLSERLNLQDGTGEQHATRDSVLEENFLCAVESYVRALTGNDAEPRPKPMSFIRPVMAPPLQKTDRVAKYFQYKQMWELFKVPGEREHRALRWAVKERLANPPPQTRPRPVQGPNHFTVPTDKKRSAAMRWRVRTDLGHGLIRDQQGC